MHQYFIFYDFVLSVSDDVCALTRLLRIFLLQLLSKILILIRFCATLKSPRDSPTSITHIWVSS